MPPSRWDTCERWMRSFPNRLRERTSTRCCLRYLPRFALLLAAIGIYGLISYGVEQRMQGVGIRVALGAARGDVLRMIVMQGAKLLQISCCASPGKKGLESGLNGDKDHDSARKEEGPRIAPEPLSPS